LSPGAGGRSWPGITRTLRGVDDQRARCSVSCGVLVFVIPAAVPEPDPGSLERRVEVHQHHHLAADVDVLVVVPSVLGGRDAIACEHQSGILHRSTVLVRRRTEHQVRLHSVSGMQHQLVGLRRERHVPRNVSAHLDQRHRLQEGTVVARGLVSHRLELRGEIFDGQLVAGLSGFSPLELVVGEEANVARDFGGRDPVRRGTLRGRCSQQQGDGENHGALCYPGSGPVATGRAGSSIQPLNDPTYRRAGGSPAISMASASWQAVTPLPQETMTSLP